MTFSLPSRVLQKSRYHSVSFRSQFRKVPFPFHQLFNTEFQWRGSQCSLARLSNPQFFHLSKWPWIKQTSALSTSCVLVRCSTENSVQVCGDGQMRYRGMGNVDWKTNTLVMNHVILPSKTSKAFHCSQNKNLTVHWSLDVAQLTWHHYSRWSFRSSALTFFLSHQPHRYLGAPLPGWLHSQSILWLIYHSCNHPKTICPVASCPTPCQDSPQANALFTVFPALCEVILLLHLYILFPLPSKKGSGGPCCLSGTVHGKCKY